MDRYSAKRSFSPSCSHSLHSCHSSHLRHPGYASHLHYFVTCVTSVTTVILVAFLSPLILPSFFAFATPYSPLSPQNLSPLSLLLPFTMSCLVLCCIPCHIPNYIPCPTPHIVHERHRLEPQGPARKRRFSHEKKTATCRRSEHAEAG